METLTAIPAQRVVPARSVPVSTNPAGAHVRSLLQDPTFWLVCYLAALAAVAFWPTPVDRDAKGLIDATTEAASWLSYARIEFSANIVMFMPLGFLLMKIRGGAPLTVVAIACCASLSMEIVQGAFFEARTQSAMDVVAHTLGASLGVQIALLVDVLLRRRRVSPLV